MKHTRKNAGFTLVELAIVLVIIGLIIGGVLTGQDLIKAATIRSTVGDIEKFNAAATTFQGKYNGLPGDLAASRAVEFNLAAGADANSAGTAGLRDGNSVIEGGAAAATNLAGETALLWKDLGATGLIAGTYSAIGTAVGPAAAVTAANVRTYLPGTRLRDSASYYVYSLAGRNYFYLGTVAAAITTGAVTPTAGVTALEAKSIDEKIDDGAPTSGVVISMTDLTTANAGAAAATTECNTNATPSVYNVSSAATGAASNVVCQLRIRTSF
ncbi:MAG: prepilin-type N-terminal cleavage/methylation domain-containing protein [Alphaproteobacteria bacterium]|nr:prepilin-type N-terminal cleavage/methylation domain-containing protein [Alphaproteobacteria bacterium]